MKKKRTAQSTSRRKISPPAVADDLGSWALEAQEIAIQKGLANISPPDGQPGAVLASPSRSNPDYYYHWVRDGARAMRTFVHLYDTSTDERKKTYGELLRHYVEFTKLNQTTPTLSNSPGEPKFYVSGQAFSGPWGRPQNDGPAQRALVLTRWAQQLILDGDTDYVTGVLYDGKEPSFSVIKSDLDFIGHNWGDSCFDLWEEVDGTHFYTRMQQRVALREGAALATRLNDPGAASFYNDQAQAIESQMERFWNAKANYIDATIDRIGGIDDKTSDLDTCAVIAACETWSKLSSFYGPSDDRVLATANALHQAFVDLYPINATDETEQGLPIYPGIGRYSEDTYDGSGTRGHANPWFLCTLALSGMAYKASHLLAATAKIVVNGQNVDTFSRAAKLIDPEFALSPGKTVRRGTLAYAAIIDGLVAMGDAYLRRVRLHAGPDGSLSEQFDRNTGFMTSARDLTWSYMALALTVQWRVDATSGR